MMTGSASSLEDLVNASTPLLGDEAEDEVETQAEAAAEAEKTGKDGNEGEGAELTSVRVDDGAEVDEIQAVPAVGYGAIEGGAQAAQGSAEGAGESDEGKEKKLKKQSKSVADTLKTDMAAERTFFKWLWTGLHTGAIGSFIFVTFDGNKNDPMRLVVVGFSWTVALALVLYGTFAYYARRRALRTGRLEEIPTWSREHSPLIVLAALISVVGAALGYALVGGGTVSEKGVSIVGGV